MNRIMTIKIISSVMLVLAAFGYGMGNKQGPLKLLSGSQEKKAIEIMRAGLKSSDAMVRANTTEAVSRSEYAPLMDDVAELINDDIIPVRFAAMMTIGDLRYSPAEYVITPHLKEPDENMRMVTAYALTRLGSDNHAVIVADGLNSSNQTIKANSALLLGKMDNPEIKKILSWVLRDDAAEDKVKIQAIESLARMGDQDMYHKGWALLISKRSDDRIIGVRVMVLLGTSDATNAIKTMLRDDLVEIQVAAAAALARLGEPAGGAVLKEYFEKISGGVDKETRQRCNIQAAMGLMYLDQKKFGKYTRILVNDKSEMIRIYGAMVVLKNQD